MMELQLKGFKGIILAFLIAFPISLVSGGTVYSRAICEDRPGSIYCTGGKLTQVVSAIYGRLDKTLCPGMDPKYIQNTNCRLDVTDKLKAQCDGKTGKCAIEVSNEFFGRDPCPNTYKYVFLSFSCNNPL